MSVKLHVEYIAVLLANENLQSAFKRTGIYPLNRNIIPNEALAPAEVFEQSSSDITIGALNQPDQDHS